MSKSKTTKNDKIKILNHPDKDEIISKLLVGLYPKDINQWLSVKYSNPEEKKFVLSERIIKLFKDEYLDIYTSIKEDLAKTQMVLADNSNDELALSVQNNKAYKDRLVELAGQELDIKKMLANMIVAVEGRAMQVFDLIQQNPENINTKHDRLLLEYFDRLGQNLERWSKYVIGTPDQVIQHNYTISHIDQHVSVLQEAIRDTLAEMDIESSIRFIDILGTKMNKLKLPTEKELTTEARLAEVKVLNDEVTKKLIS